MVEGARLERGCAVTRTEGSNPSLSAIKNHNLLVVVFCFALIKKRVRTREGFGVKKTV